MPTVGDESDDPTVLDWARRYIKQKYAKPGNVYLGVVHRLDRPVSGAVLLARTSKAARRLTEQFRTGTVQKTYWAVVEGRPRQREGELVHWLVKDRRRNVVRAYPSETPGGKLAVTRYRTLAIRQRLALLEVHPITGRAHQIRVQLSAGGLPILGDTKYGARRQFGRAVALHARELQFEHPVESRRISVVAPLPATWTGFRALLREVLGGAPSEPAG